MIELFWKNSSYVSSLSVCIFVAWCVQISVAGANKVEGTMSWCVRKQWDFGIWHYIHSAWGQTRAVWDRHVDCSQFFRLLLRLKVFRSMILKYLWIWNDNRHKTFWNRSLWSWIVVLHCKKCHPVLYIDIIKCLFIDDWVSFVNSLHIEMEALDCKAVVDT